MKSQDIAVVGILLAVGAIVRYLSLVIPGPIVSNLVIAFYCLAIILVVPRLSEALGIGLVAGVVCAMISHSIFPPANLVSEPVGAVVCLLIYRAARNRIALAPGISALLGTLASGFTFTGVAMVMMAPAILTKYATLGAFVLTIIPIVVITAFVNSFIVQVLYFPGSRVVTGSHTSEDRRPRSEQPVISDIIPDAGDALIRLQNFGYTYEGSDHPALKAVDLAVRKGEVLLITGPTAAGKTTLCHAMAGILHHESDGTITGSVTFRGHDIGEYAGMGELSRHIGMVFDDADAQLIFTTVEEELSSGLANRGLSREEIFRRVENAMARTDIADLKDRAPHTLSGGQKQRVVLAATLALDTDLLILDESTSELDTEATRTIVGIISELRNEGKTILVVDHNVAEFRDVADRAIMMDKGEIIAQGNPEPVLGNLKKSVPPASSPVGTPVPAGVAPIISVNSLYQQFGDVHALSGVNLDIYPGEFVAIIGENGSGKTTLIKHFNGLLQPIAGTVTVAGADTSSTPVTELVQHSGLVFQNPDTMLFEENVADEVAFGVRNIGQEQPDELVSRSLTLVGLDGKQEIFPRHLSRGERQRLAVACILAMHPEVIVLDEPTTGLDFEESEKMMMLMKQLNDQGHTIVMVTHNMQIVDAFAHRIIRMEGGQIVDDLTTGTGVGA